MNAIRITSFQLGALKSRLMADTSRESAAILTAGFIENPQGTHFTIRGMPTPCDEDYGVRAACNLQMLSLFLNRAIGMAERDGVALILSHTHPFPGNGLSYSESDMAYERESYGTVRWCLGDRPMGSLLLGPDTMIGRVWPADGRIEPVDQLRIVDRHVRFKPLGSRPASSNPVDAGLYDRQIRAFGLDGQKVLSCIRICIVGLGGTGSAVAEQLAGAHVRHFALVDHDRFSPSNRMRMYGTDASTERDPRVEIVGAHIARISPESSVEQAEVDVVSREGLTLLRECDLVFSCTDRHRPRSVLNELAYQLFIPVTDVGVGLDSWDGGISGGSVRVNLASPSLPCLYCAGVISADRMLAESLGPRDRSAKVQGGYVAGLDDDAPSAVSLTTMAASLAVLLFKDVLFRIATLSACMVMADVSTLAMRTLSPQSRQGCVCALRMGRGECMPMSAPHGAGRK